MQKTFHIAIPESLQIFIEYRMEVNGYRKVSEYLRELVRSDQRLETARLEAAARRQPGAGESRQSVMEATRRF